MQSQEIRQKFLDFFEKRGHVVIPSASLVPANDSSVLFNTAGMQPLVPYLLGQKHPQGERLANIQKCVRTNDIDEVGDNTHLTFFEMMGNWSLGDYWKKESINWSYELLTNSPDLPKGDAGFGLDPQRLYVTCFEGDENAPRDDESAQIWKEIFEKNRIIGERIYFRPKEKNWWSAGPNGPCGPDTEMFYDLSGTLNKGMTLGEYLKADDEQDVVEIWNNVFMEFLAKEGRVVGRLENRNVDTGAGFERVVAVIQEKENVFETDLFQPIIKEIERHLPTINLKSKRIISDHIRASMFLLADGVEPSNKDRGYILRRLLRRAISYTYKADKDFDSSKFELVAKVVANTYQNYPELNNEAVYKKLKDEARRFRKTIEEGFKKLDEGADPFILATSYGFPIELAEEFAKVDRTDFNEKFKRHQETSRAGAEQKFKGGLAGHSEIEVKYHTATHLLHQALRAVLGEDVFQKGSNITPERLRFDFSFSRKMTDEEKKAVEDLVNEKIKESSPVSYEDIPFEEAKKKGAIGLFEEKYGDRVRIYKVGDFSLEFCGGPHVENTSVLGKFKIAKEEAVSIGTRRIKAVLE